MMMVDEDIKMHAPCLHYFGACDNNYKRINSMDDIIL